MLVTTVVTSTFTSNGWVGTTQYTTTEVTGTLIPEQREAHGNIFEHSPGALAGLVVGVIAFVALLLAWGLLAYRRHRAQHLAAEATAAALANNTSRRSGPMLADEDDDDAPPPISPVSATNPFEPSTNPYESAASRSANPFDDSAGMVHVGAPVSLMAGIGAGAGAGAAAGAPYTYNRLRGGSSGDVLAAPDGPGSMRPRSTTELADLALARVPGSNSGSRGNSGAFTGSASGSRRSTAFLSAYSAGGGSAEGGNATEEEAGMTGSGEGEGDALIARASDSGFFPPIPIVDTGAGPAPPRPARSPARSRRSSSGLEPAAWLSRRGLGEVAYVTVPMSVSSSVGHDGNPGGSPALGSPALGLDSASASGDPFRDPPDATGVGLGQGANPGNGCSSGSGSEELNHVTGAGASGGMAGVGVSSGSSHGHGGYISGGSTHGQGGSLQGHGSAHGHEYASGGSAYGHGAGSSENGHTYAATAPVHEGRRSPGPSSLLPTQSAVPPPTAYRPPRADDDDDEYDDEDGGSTWGRKKTRRRKSFLGIGGGMRRPLPWKRASGRTSGSSATSNTEGTRSSYARGTTSGSASESPAMSKRVSPVTSFYTPRAMGVDPLVAMPAGITAAPSMVASVPRHGFARPHSPTLPPGSLRQPPLAFLARPYASADNSDSSPSAEGQAGYGYGYDYGYGHGYGVPLPAWRVVADHMPSPAPTEGSSHNAPEGLLDPRLGQLGTVAMRSQGAISFRDEMDYSRPIGGLVNNRQHSQTTFRTVETHDDDDDGDDDDDDDDEGEEADEDADIENNDGDADRESVDPDDSVV